MRTRHIEIAPQLASFIIEQTLVVSKYNHLSHSHTSNILMHLKNDYYSKNVTPEIVRKKSEFAKSKISVIGNKTLRCIDKVGQV